MTTIRIIGLRFNHCLGLAFTILLLAAFAPNVEAACNTNVYFEFGVSGLNGRITVSLSDVLAEAEDDQEFCYGPPIAAADDVDLVLNKKYTLKATWASECRVGDMWLIVTNGCPCYSINYGSGTSWGTESNGGFVVEISLVGTNRVLFSSNPLLADGTSTAIASLQDPYSLGTNISWSIVDPSLGARVLSTGTNGTWCMIQSGTNEGSITVKATGSNGCEASGILNLQPCSGCTSGCAVGEGDPKLGSVNYEVRLGRADQTTSAGSLHIKANAPSMALYSISTIHYDFVHTNVMIVRDGSNFVRQVKTPQLILNVVSNSTLKYTLDMYDLADIVSYSNELFQISGTPFATFTVENPDGTGATSNRVQITESRGGIYRVSLYAVTNGVWYLTTGGGLRTESESTVVTNGYRIVTREIRNPSGTVASLVTRKYENFAFGEGMVEEILGTGLSALTNSFSYYTNGMLRQSVRADGSWEYYLYDSEWRPTNVFSSWLGQAPTTNSALCRLTEYSYSSNTVTGSGDDSLVRSYTPRRVIEYVAGTEVSRRYNVQYFLSSTNELLIQEIRCQTAGAAWDATDNLVTYTLHFADGPYRGQPRLIVHPDRNADSYSYSVGTNGETKTVTQSGRISFGEFVFYLATGGHDYPEYSGVGFGRETETVTDSLGTLLARTNRLIYGALWPTPPDKFDLDWEVHSGFDSSLRSTRTDYNDGTFALTDYGCCGIQTFTNREGTVTSYGMDALKRRTTTTTSGIVLSNVLDAVGNTLSTVRYGTDNSMITTFSSVFDSAGQMMSLTDAVGNTTIYTNYWDGSGYRVRQTTFPGGSTRIERYYRDGSLYDVSGTAAYPVTYAYGVTNDSAGRLFVVEQKGTEWTMTINNMLGKHHKTVYAAPSAPFPYEQSYYDSISGKLTKKVDPDGVITLFFDKDGLVDDYDFTYGYTESTLDLDRDSVVDYSGTDRITGNYYEPATGMFDGFSYHERFSTTVATTDNSSSTFESSVTDRSPDGLRTVQTVNGLSSTNSTFYGGGGLRYLTNSAPDGTYTLTTFRDGRMVAAQAVHSSVGTLRQFIYGYDTHGRRSVETNVANSTATFSYYDAADRLVTNTVIAIDVAAQTTVSVYDERGRLSRTIFPDGTSSTNEYYTTGLLKKTTGSRTYPVQYSYDSQGRMTNMTTWQDYATSTGSANTAWKYDGYRGFMTNKLYADGKGTGYAYTNSGRLVKRSWARGISTAYGYNNAGDVSVVDYSDTTPDIAYTYNRRGWQESAANGTTNTAFLYGNSGVLLAESYSNGPLSGLILTNSYDSLLRRTNLALRNGGTTLLSHSYTYDAASRLFGVSDGTNSAAYRYLTGSGIVREIAFTNSGALRMVTTRQYDGLYRLTNTVSSNASAVVVNSHGYQYNSANQRTLTTREDGSYWVYQYDALGQVTSGKKYWRDGTPVAAQQFDYGFDDIGNRETAASGGDQFGANLRVENYSVNNLNQYTQRTVPGKVDILGAASTNGTVTVNYQSTYRKGEFYRAELSADNSSGPVWLSVTNIGALKDGANPDIVSTNTGNVLLPKAMEAFTHDADGNLTSDSLWTNTWNGENRLIALESGSGVPSGGKDKESWSHLPGGRWCERVIYSWNGSTYVAQSTNRFVWDHQVILAVLNHTNGVETGLLRGLDLSGSHQGAGGLDGVLGISLGTNGHYFAVSDGNGNIAVLAATTNGSLAASYEYSPNGAILQSHGVVSKANPIRWNTQFTDDISASVRYLFREYNPDSAKWLSRDSLQERGGINLFGYLNNAATRFADSDGRQMILLQPALARPILEIGVEVGGGVGIGIAPPITIVPMPPTAGPDTGTSPQTGPSQGTEPTPAPTPTPVPPNRTPPPNMPPGPPPNPGEGPKRCRLIRSYSPNPPGNPSRQSIMCPKVCWYCIYRCDGGDPRGGAIDRYQPGGCLQEVGWVPGWATQSACEDAVKKGIKEMPYLGF
jgi:RHS repeat-associated protein